MTLTELPASYQQRFGGIARLYGEESLAMLARAHFVIIGLGGVGTWVAEALARSGIGTLTLIELDEVCITNTNRQSHALTSTVGQAKNHVVCDRLRDINPDIQLHPIDDFLDQHNMTNLIHRDHDIVIDAMDSAHIKARLIAYCSAIKVRPIVSGSSGGKHNPAKITVSDLGKTDADPMLSKVRSQLYRKHNFARDVKRKFRVDAVYSTEQMVYPKPDGSVCMDKQVLDGGVKLDCASGFGSSVMVTGTFGFLMASRAVECYLHKTLGREIPFS